MSQFIPASQPTLAYGYDVAIAIEPETYEVDPTADFQFRMNDTARRRLSHGLKDNLERPQDVESLTVAPGYIRVKAVPQDREAGPKDLVDSLRGLANDYNREYAEYPEHDGIHFGDYHLAVYRPEGPPSAEQYLEAHIGSDAAPDTDGPLYERDRAASEARRPVQTSERQLGYEYIFPLDGEKMYSPPDTLGGGPVFRWDDDVLERFGTVLDDTPRWPGTPPEEIARVAVFPEYIAVHHRTSAMRPPIEPAESACRALAHYNAIRGTRDDLGGTHETVKRRRIALTNDVYIGALPTAVSQDVDAWIAERGLDDEDGEPRQRDPTPGAEADDEDSAWSALNPFGG